MSVSPELTSLEILGIAIRSEIEAAKLYARMGGKVRNSDLKEKLDFLRSEEEKHRALFEDLFRKNYPDVELKLPETSSVPLMDAALSREMSLKELFEIAMEAEKMSMEFYSDLARSSKDMSGASMLTYLSNVERGHYNLVKNEYEMLVEYPAYADTDDFLFGERFIHVGP